MKKHILVFILLLSGLLPILAQNNYSPGYIITNDQDTITGFIDYRTDKMNALTCHFKKDLTSPEQTYLPGQIFGYRYTDVGKFYVSKTIKIKGEERKIYLEYLLQGIMNLYYYCDESDTDYLKYYFFENKNGEMVSITKRPDKIITERNGDLKKMKDIKYKGVISYIFKDCDPVKQKATQTQFRHKDMIRLTKDYHKLVCTAGEECIEFETTPDKHNVKTKISVYGGFENVIDAPSFTLKGNYDISCPVKYSPFAIIGVELNFSLPRWKKAVSMQTDFSLAKQHFYVDDYDYIYGGIHDYRYDALRLASNIGVKYTHQKGKVRPCIEAGMIINYGLNVKESYSDLLHKETISTCSPGCYTGLGFDYDLGNEHYILCRINGELRHNYFGVKDSMMTFWKIKLGYTF